MEHLGYGPIDDLESKLNYGVDCAVDYFFGDWWRANEDDARALDKSREDRSLAWFEPLWRGLLLAGLANRWDDFHKICSWFDGPVELEYRGGRDEDHEMLLFLCIASHFAPQPLAGVEQWLPEIRKARARRPRLVCAAWEAALAGDQATFNKTFKESVAHFLKVDAEGVSNVNYWVALKQSLVWLIAEQQGLTFPPLNEKQDAAVVRRQTIGLAE